MADFEDFLKQMLSRVAAFRDVSYQDLVSDFPGAGEQEQQWPPVTFTEALTIVSWHGADEPVFDEGSLDNPLVRGGLGGIWRDDPPWDEYVASWRDPGDHARLECLKAHLVANNIRRGGRWHQSQGIPQFSDGSYMYFSQRAWGDLMAAIWGGHYCHYAWED